MKLLRNTQMLKKYIGGAANASLEWLDIAPTHEAVVHDYMMQFFPVSMLSTISQLTGDPEENTSAYFILSAAAHLTMYEYAQIGGVQVSGAGMLRSETENMKTAFKYQEIAYRDYMLNHGYNQIEGAIILLNGEENELWEGSEDRKRQLCMFINTAKEFQLNFSKPIGRYVFEMIKPIMEDIELFAIQPTIGKELYDILKEKLIAGEVLTTEEETLTHFIEKAVANLTIKFAVSRKWISLTANKVVSLTVDETYAKENTATGEQIAQSIDLSQLIGDRYLATILDYMKDHFAEYLPASEEDPVPGDLSCGHCPGKGCTKKSKGKGIVHF